jgi:orotidine-5'-phosphate decarboxylase
VPGIGAQGGNLEAVIRFGKNADYGLIINSSRNIIFSDKHSDFQQAAKIAAKTIQQEMQKLLF